MAVMAMIIGTLYHIWECRNVCRQQYWIKHPNEVCKEVKENIMIRLQDIKYAKGKNNTNLLWLEKRDCIKSLFGFCVTV